MEIRIAKFSLHPKDKPVGYAVGFNIVMDRGNSFYRDTVVSLEEAKDKSSDEIVLAAWNKIKEFIVDQALEEVDREPLLGSRWDPPEEDIPEKLADHLVRSEETDEEIKNPSIEDGDSFEKG